MQFNFHYLWLHCIKLILSKFRNYNPRHISNLAHHTASKMTFCRRTIYTLNRLVRFNTLQFKFFKYPETPGINSYPGFIIFWFQISGKINVGPVYNYFNEFINNFFIRFENLRRRLNCGISSTPNLNQTDSYMGNFFLLDVFFSLGSYINFYIFRVQLKQIIIAHLYFLLFS